MYLDIVECLSLHFLCVPAVRSPFSIKTLQKIDLVNLYTFL